MLIMIFLGVFGIWMAFFTMIRIYLEGDRKRGRRGEIPRARAIPTKERVNLKLSSAANPSIKQAFSDLWKEILKGA